MYRFLTKLLTFILFTIFICFNNSFADTSPSLSIDKTLTEESAVEEEEFNLDELEDEDESFAGEIPEMRDISLKNNLWTLLPLLAIFYLAIYTRREWQKKANKPKSKK